MVDPVEDGLTKLGGLQVALQDRVLVPPPGMCHGKFALLALASRTHPGLPGFVEDVVHAFHIVVAPHAWVHVPERLERVVDVW